MKVTLDFKKWISPRVKRRLAPLGLVFRELRSVHEDYIAGEAAKGGQWKDWPFWYKERTHTGLLAAAIWRAGGTALEEYTKLKARDSKGRCDLWINIKEARFECEAKYGWIDLGKKPEAAAELAMRTLASAEDAVKNLRDKEAGKGLALGFLATGIKKVKQDSAGKAIEDCIDELKGNAKCHALVWIGASVKRHPFREGEWLHKGLLLVVKEVK